ncbi:hypothetical protein C2845_PM10G01560 [Panicum miliaceum]|uniref:AB hydrolase-1 domain-containing protein n=1 Tax=Panicum miliaceum TaxID=4540 RepID=A0A3L6PFI5_PANMI|nr:hypothetical protein C2845_PM10G01560 [Panicum miliaceum]
MTGLPRAPALGSGCRLGHRSGVAAEWRQCGHCSLLRSPDDDGLTHWGPGNKPTGCVQSGGNAAMAVASSVMSHGRRRGPHTRSGELVILANAGGHGGWWCRVRTFLIEAFMCHTHNAAWHTLHNIICGSAARMDVYLDVLSSQLSCKVAVFHGRDDELLPVECALAVGARVPRARVTVYDRKDHITIIVGQEELFAAELEAIWRSAAAD